jgi:hypothetical protein
MDIYGTGGLARLRATVDDQRLLGGASNDTLEGGNWRLGTVLIGGTGSGMGVTDGSGAVSIANSYTEYGEPGNWCRTNKPPWNLLRRGSLAWIASL